MKEKKIPMRTCAVTGEKLPKWDLIRIISFNKIKKRGVIYDECIRICFRCK